MPSSSFVEVEVKVGVKVEVEVGVKWLKQFDVILSDLIRFDLI